MAPFIPPLKAIVRGLSGRLALPMARKQAPALMAGDQGAIAPVMADEPGSLVLQLLQRMDAKLDRAIEEVQDLKVRMTNVEESLAGVNRRLDRLEVRQDRVERRLELSGAPR